GARKPTTERWSVFCFQRSFSLALLQRAGWRSSDSIDPSEQPPELATDNRGITERADAGDVNVDRCATVRAALRGDRPRLTGGHRRWTLIDPVFGPAPAIRIAADDPSASIQVVVG